MKTFQAAIFFAFLGMSFAGRLTEDMLLPAEKVCIKELGLETQTVLDSVDDNFLTTEGNSNINDLTLCAYKKLNIVDENNEVKYDALKTFYSSYIKLVDKDVVNQDQAASDAVEACKGLEGSGLGDYLVKLGNCAVRKVRNI